MPTLTFLDRTFVVKDDGGVRTVAYAHVACVSASYGTLAIGLGGEMFLSWHGLRESDARDWAARIAQGMEAAK